MILTQRKVDNVDKVQLITSMMAANYAEDRMPEGELARVSVPEFGEFAPLAEIALVLIAQMHRQSEDDWDGVVWFERFENNGRDSLADRLVEFIVENDPTEEEIREVVIAWLKAEGL